MRSDGHGPVFGYPSAQTVALTLRAEVDLLRLPAGLSRMNQLLSAAPVDLRRLGDAGVEDAGIVNRVLHLSNSSLFNLSPHVNTLEQAVSVLDSEVVRELLLTCWLIRFSGERAAASENHAFWRHSLIVARLSRRLAEWIDFAQPERAFLAGLLHDAGMLPFLTLYSRCGVPDRQRILDYAGDAIDPQRRQFGADHCELGSKMAAALDFPASIAETAARHHHRGAILAGALPVSLVACAECISLAVRRSQQAAPPAAGMAIRNALAEYLPHLLPQAGSGLVEALECELTQSAPQETTAGPPDWGECAFRAAGPAEIG